MRSRIVFHRNGSKTFEIEGQVVTEKEYRKHVSRREIAVPMLGGNTSAAWPCYSDALAVHPSQIPEAREFYRKRGVAADFDPEDGRAIIADRAMRRDMMKETKVHDRLGGYGDDHHTPTEKEPERKFFDGTGA